MKKFVELVDLNAQNKAYRKILGLYKDEIAGHMINIVFYREVSKLVIEIRMLLKNKKGNEEKIEQLRDKLGLTIQRWKNE